MAQQKQIHEKKNNETKKIKTKAKLKCFGNLNKQKEKQRL